MKWNKPERWMICQVREDGSAVCELDPEKAEQVSFFDYKVGEGEGERRVIHIKPKGVIKSSVLREKRNSIEKRLPAELSEIESVELE